MLKQNQHKQLKSRSTLRRPTIPPRRSFSALSSSRRKALHLNSKSTRPSQVIVSDSQSDNNKTNNMSRPNHTTTTTTTTTLPITKYDPVSIGFQQGQFAHILTDLPASYQKRYTTAVTITNPETTMQTEHDNVVLDHYYDPNFDPEQFNLTIQTFALRFPTSVTGKFIPVLQNLDLSSKWRSRRSIQDDTDHVILVPSAAEMKQKGAASGSSTHRRYLLASGIFPETLSQQQFTITNTESTAMNDSDSAVTTKELKTTYSHQELVKGLPESIQELISTLTIEIVPQTVTFNYNYFLYEEIMAGLMKPNMTVPTGFTPTGHIAHFNLRHDQLPWQYVAGRVLADKINGITTVINKVGMINNVFRNFQAEILYGEDNFVTEIKENGFTFSLDFSQVYWNSRLLTEHGRLSKFIHKWWRRGDQGGQKKDQGDTCQTDQKQVQVPNQTPQTDSPTYALDLFGGIGPFVIPLVKNQGALSTQHQQFGYNPHNTAKCVVWGNDINPKSSLYMWKNAVKNRCVGTAEQIQKDAKRAAMRQKAHKEAAQTTTQSATITGTKSAVPLAASDNTEPNLRVFNSCGRELISLIAKQQMVSLIFNKFKQSSPPTNTNQNNKNKTNNSTPLPFFQHTLMNLPASAVQFLDMYVGLYTNKTMSFVPEIETIGVVGGNVNQGAKSVKIVNLTSHSKLSDADTQNPPDFLDKLVEIDILPPSFDPKYEKIVDDMDINDSNHHWSTIQSIYQNGTHSSSQNSQPQPTLSINNPLSPSHTLYVPSIRDIQTTIMKRQLAPVDDDEEDPITTHTPRSADENNLIVHCHCFVRDPIDPFGESLNLVEGYLGFQLKHDQQHQQQHSQLKSVRKTGLPMRYDNQLPIINDSNIDAINRNLASLLESNTTSLSRDVLSSGPQSDHDTSSSPVDINSRQQNYLTSPSFTQWRNDLNPHTPPSIASVASKELVRSYDELLLMEYCLQKDGLFIHHVRNVAPGKEMMCVSFVVPDYVLFYSPEYYNHLGGLMMRRLELNTPLLGSHSDGHSDDITTPFSSVLSHLTTTNTKPVVHSEYDNTIIDDIDLKLWQQQSLYLGHITPTSFLQTKIQHTLTSPQQPLPQHNLDSNESLEGLSKLPNQNTRSLESPGVGPMDETTITQANKRLRN